MSSLLAVDPGVHYLAWARFVDARLVEVGVVTAGKDLPRARRAAWLANSVPPADIVVSEAMETRGLGSQAALQDILEINLNVGGLILHFFPREGYALTPTEWKNNAPKTVTQNRTHRALDAEEAQVLVDYKGPKKADILDAVAIGLTHLRRI